MNIKKEEDLYLVESSKKGKFYKVNPYMPMCECPYFHFHQIKVHGECKHIIAVKELMAKEGIEAGSSDTKAAKGGSDERCSPSADSKKDQTQQILREAEDWVDVIELFDKYGEAQVQSLIDRGELLEQRGKVKVMK